MDPMSMFDMERRTGIASDDVEDFASRMDMVRICVQVPHKSGHGLTVVECGVLPRL